MKQLRLDLQDHTEIFLLQRILKGMDLIWIDQKQISLRKKAFLRLDMYTDTAPQDTQKLIFIMPVKRAAFDRCHECIHQQVGIIIDTFIDGIHNSLLPSFQTCLHICDSNPHSL